MSASEINDHAPPPPEPEAKEPAVEIHKPKAVHGWREFVNEIGIIVIGVLIALAGEQIVEYLHWQSKVAEADVSMRNELVDDDGAQAYARSTLARCIDSQLAAVGAALVRQRDLGGPLPTADVHWPSLLTWDDDAWRSAIAGNVTSHMEAEHMARLSATYDLIPLLSRANAKETEDAADLHSLAYAKAPLAPAERDRLFLAIERLRRDNAIIADGAHFFLENMKAAGLALPPATLRSILTSEHKRWGRCVEDRSIDAIIGQPPFTSS